MAILVAVLAPQYLKYVDRSRNGRDVQNVDNLYSAVQAALADPNLGGQITHCKFTITKDADMDITGDPLTVGSTTYQWNSADHPIMKEIFNQ